MSVFSKTMFRGLLLALIVAFCLTPAMSQAAVRGGSRNESKAAAVRVQERVNVFQSLWRGLVGFFEKNGNSIDPSGATGAPGTGTDSNGASIDPSGAPGHI
jgi:hypothetical protein